MITYENSPLTIDEMFTEASSRVEWMLKMIKQQAHGDDSNIARARKANSKRQTFRRAKKKLDELLEEGVSPGDKAKIKEIEKYEKDCCHCSYMIGMMYRVFLSKG